MPSQSDLNALINSGCLSLSAFEDLYEKYKENPALIDPSWRNLFVQVEQTEVPLSTLPESSSVPILPPETSQGRSVLYHPVLEITGIGDGRILKMIEAYRTYGHLLADTNPISMHPPSEPYQLKLEAFGFSRQDLSQTFPTFGLLEAEQAPLLEIVNALKSIYCSKVGIEYMGLFNQELEHWLQARIEKTRFQPDLTIEQKRMLLQYLNKSELLESFLHTKYVGQKRFSLEGAETLIPMLAACIDSGASGGVMEYVIGMPHRGRLNVLCNIFDKSYGDVFSEFEENYIPESIEGSGDVKYHKGFYSEVKTIHGHEVKLTLTPNPSHLESVDPVVEGQTRARQTLTGDEPERKKIIPILIHGDAAISGQGIVYETLQLCRLKGYETGGTIHFIINNQIGFTTLPKDSRSTHYCSDIAHAFGAPVFHVNAEDPESCVYASTLAMEIRQKFHCDVFIDLNCYRKYGHNEGDEPAFTQPLEYKRIKQKQNIRDIYRDGLIHQGILEQDLAEKLESEFKAALQRALESEKKQAELSQTVSNGEVSNKKAAAPSHPDTAVPKEILKEAGRRLCTIPKELTVHPKLAALTKERLSMLENEDQSKPVDWGMAELLAYATLLWEGKQIRISGQDTCRGTFSHRHALLVDQVKEQGYIPLQHLKEGQGPFEIYNSPLSEFAALGFEFGYSVANPAALVIWEAQFGDFANGAQVIIDQYISSAEQKWEQKFRLTLFLPHGYEGQGPEHSSGRMERFLTLAGDNNMIIANPTTPAQLFHLLRRQALQQMLKPLIVFTPKGLLRYPQCISKLDDLSQGSFQEILQESNPQKNAHRLLLCSGRIFYNLLAEREKRRIDDTAILRIEQLYPFNGERFKELVSAYPAIKEAIWVQEEPSNMGAWTFIRPILGGLLPKAIELSYAGRPRSASPATGLHAIHDKEHQAIMDAVFGDRRIQHEE